MARQKAITQARLADQVNISIDARRKQIIEKITAEIVANIGARFPGLRQGMDAVEKEALNYLSQEVGARLEIYQDEASGSLLFRELDAKTGEEIRTLSRDESRKLQERLFDITQDIIDKNMV